MCCSGYTNRLATTQSPYSYFSLFGICFDQACRDAKIQADCETKTDNASNGNRDEDLAFLNDCIQKAKQSATGGSSSKPDTLNTGLTVLQQILCVADPKHCPNVMASSSNTPPVAPPPPPPAKFLGMPAPLGIGVALLGTAALIWGIVTVASPKKPAVAVS